MLEKLSYHKANEVNEWSGLTLFNSNEIKLFDLFHGKGTM